MFGHMMGPPGESERDKLREPKPKRLREWPSYLLRNTRKLFRRLFYIYGLVWDARPWIFITMIFMTVFNGVSPVIGAYISKLLLDALAKAASGQLGDNFWALGGLLIFQIAYQFFVSLVNSLNNMVNRLSNEIIVYSIKLKIMNKAKTIDLADFDLPDFYSKLENANRERGLLPSLSVCIIAGRTAAAGTADTAAGRTAAGCTAAGRTAAGRTAAGRTSPRDGSCRSSWRRSRCGAA